MNATRLIEGSGGLSVLQPSREKIAKADAHANGRAEHRPVIHAASTRHRRKKTPESLAPGFPTISLSLRLASAFTSLFREAEESQSPLRRILPPSPFARAGGRSRAGGRRRSAPRTCLPEGRSTVRIRHA